MRDLENKLIVGLSGTLPGVRGQLLMAPRPRRGWLPGPPFENCRHGGGLLLVYPHAAAPHVLLTLRNPGLPQHAGQVSLPGGAVEADETYEHAALREASEEVGLDPAAVRTLGGLSPLHVPVSRFVIHPWVGLVDHRPEFTPDPREVARILEVALRELQDPSRQRVEQREQYGRTIEVPFFGLEGEKVWGATAMILAEFLCLLGTPPTPGPDSPRRAPT